MRSEFVSEQYAEQADAIVDNDISPLDDEPSVVLDEDRMGADPLEDGMDTAEGYSRDVRIGGTQAAEERDNLDYRIPQEEPDPALAEIDADPGRPVAATPIDDLDEHVDDPEHAVDGVGGTAVLDPLAADGAVDDERLTDGAGEVELGVSSAGGAVEATGLPADDSVGEVVPVENEWPTEGAEQQALHVEQES
jgi:hypothetical protein